MADPVDYFNGSAVPNTADFVRLAEEWEEWLGDPRSAANTLSFSCSLVLDEREEIPVEAVARLRALGLQRQWVPVAFGGRLRSCEELVMLLRVLARRDMNVAVSESTQLWMMLLWIGGEPSQHARISGALLRGEVIPCLAYSEEAHGADLAANETVAARTGDGYRISGRKWPINRAQTSTHMFLLARESSGEGPDGAGPSRRQSMFLLEKAALKRGRIVALPRVPTVGLRGCDISGVALEAGEFDDSARIGGEGDGLALALRGLFVTRGLCTGLSLGVGDTMLRTAAEHLGGRELYGGPAGDIPYVREVLADSYLSLLMAECMSIVTMRGLHVCPDEFSTWANLAKVEVSRLIEHAGGALTTALGARSMTRDHGHQGIFQKMVRDGAVVPIFDGSEPVCLDSIAGQLPVMSAARRRPRTREWRALYDLDADLPPLRLEQVTVFGRGQNAILASVPALRRGVETLEPAFGITTDRLGGIRTLAAGLDDAVNELFAAVDAVRSSPPGPASGPARQPAKTTSPQLIRLAGRACSLAVQAACLGLWLFNRQRLSGFFAEGVWLTAALSRAEAHGFTSGDLNPSDAASLADRMTSQLLADEYFSVLRIRQAAGGSAESSPPLDRQDPVERTTDR